MNFLIKREELIKPLQQVSSILKNRPILPILNNLLLVVTKDNLLLTGTDLEIEILAKIKLIKPKSTGSITVPGKKFLDICRCLPVTAEINISLSENNRIVISSNSSRYSLATVQSIDFPNFDHSQNSKLVFNIPTLVLKNLIETTQFAMAYKDVRMYLNGMLFEIENNEFRTIATDGHRLAICSSLIKNRLSSQHIIIPRKGIISLLKMLNDEINLVTIHIKSYSIMVVINNYIFSTKLISSIFPDYKKILPNKYNNKLKVKTILLKQALIRAAILSNDKYRGVRLIFSFNKLIITADNLEQEVAEEILEVFYEGNEIEICFNVNYLLDVLNAIKCDYVKLLIINEGSMLQIVNLENSNIIYIIMPLRL